MVIAADIRFLILSYVLQTWYSPSWTNGCVIDLHLDSVVVRRPWPCNLVDVLVIKEGQLDLHAVHDTELDESILVRLPKSMWTNIVFESESTSSSLRNQVSRHAKNVVVRILLTVPWSCW